MNRFPLCRIAVLAAFLMLGATAACSVQTIQPYQSHEIQPYHAHEIQPVKPGPAATPDRGGCKVSTPYSGPGNLVEPLSNGLRLEMTDPDIRQLLGPPPEQSWDARTYSYPGLQVQVGGRNKEIWDIALTSECVRLHSGIGVGSSRDEVRRTYGAADEAVTGSYKLTFTYSGNVVARVRIEPAGESFRGVSGPSSTPVQNSRPTESESAASAQPGGQSGDGLAGRWYCVSPSATVGIIAMDGRGHYTFGANSGTYQTSGMSIRFSGIPWNGGQAQIVKGNIEFYYSDARGYKYYFAFARY